MVFCIAVCGSGDVPPHESDTVLLQAELIGKYVAENQCVLVTGGRGGVMEAACKGAKQNGGMTIGILPGSRSEDANPYVDIALPTMMGERRNALLVSIADCIIAVCGRWGTLNEITYAVIQRKPIVFLKGSGGFVDKLLAGDFQKAIPGAYTVSTNPKDAVEQAINLASDVNVSKH